MVFKLPSSAGRSRVGTSLLHNRWILYFVFALALACLFFFSATGSLFSLIVFALVGFITFFFNKNMTVVLMTAISTTAIVHFLFLGGGRNDITAYLKQEGFEDSAEAEAEAAPEVEEAMTRPTKKPLRKPTTPTTPKPTESPEEEDIDKELEKLRLQKEVLDKLKNLEPFLNKMGASAA